MATSPTLNPIAISSMVPSVPVAASGTQTPTTTAASGLVPSTTTAQNATVPTGGTGTPGGGFVQGAPNSTSISSGLSTQDGSNTLVGDFKDTYGAGTGTALADTLATLGTSTNAAVAATNNAAELDASKQQANIASGLAASGISADSSTNALAQGDFAASVNANLQSTDAQMELGEENTLISALQTEGQEHGHDSSTWDSVLGGIGDAASIAGMFVGV